LRIAEARVPENPETLPDAKAALVDLARRSRARNVRADMVPAPDSGRRVGSGYTARMQAFVQQDWDFRRAVSGSAQSGDAGCPHAAVSADWRLAEATHT
jgi:hypothetical protein